MPGKSCSPGTGGRERQQRRDSAEGTFSVLRAVQAHPFLRMRIVLKHNKSCVRAEPGLGQEWLEEIRVRGTDSVQAGGQPDTSTAASQLLHQADGKKNATPTLRNHVFFPPLRSGRVSERAPRGPSGAVGFGDSFLMAGVSCVLKGCFTARLSFAEAASGHLETQHKHVTARKCIRKTSLFPKPDITRVTSKYYTHPEATWGCLWGHSGLPQARSRPWQGDALLYPRYLLGGWR